MVAVGTGGGGSNVRSDGGFCSYKEKGVNRHWVGQLAICTLSIQYMVYKMTLLINLSSNKYFLSACFEYSTY